MKGRGDGGGLLAGHLNSPDSPSMHRPFSQGDPILTLSLAEETPTACQEPASTPTSEAATDKATFDRPLLANPQMIRVTGWVEIDPSETLAANFAVMHNRRRPRMSNKILPPR